MNLFAVIINSEMHYFIDAANVEKNSVLDEYISTYHISTNTHDSNEALNNLLADIMRDLNITLKPIKLIDIYRPKTE